MDTLTEYDTQLTCELRQSGAQLPKKAHPTDACFDLVSPKSVCLPAGETYLLDLGLGIQLQEGWEAQIRGRSGLAKRGIVIHPGTIDHLYRQNVGVLIHNLSGRQFCFSAGDRIAQLKINKVYNVNLVEGHVQPTDRGGFGSTGR